MLFCECNSIERLDCSYTLPENRPDCCRYRQSAMSFPRYKHNIPAGVPLDDDDNSLEARDPG